MMSRLCLAVLVGTACALPAAQIKGSGETTARAVLSEIKKGQKMLDRIQTVAEKEGEKSFPEFHLAVHREVTVALDTEEGMGGVYSIYFGEEDGGMRGMQLLDDKTQLVIGVKPSDPKLACPDKVNKKLCITPQGVTPGRIEVFNVNEDRSTWQDTATHDLAHNVTFDPRTHTWYTDSRTYVIGNSFVYNHDEHSSGLGVTISRGVFRNGKFVGSVGVDIDLSGLDMVLGPLRPAPGAEAVLADPMTGKVIASTLPAARMVRFTHQQVSCFTAPFTQIFSPLAHTLGGLQRATRIGPVLLRADQMIGNLLRWDAIYSHPIPLSRDTTWLLVVTDDSEHRSDAAASTMPTLALLAAAALCIFL